MSLENVQAIIGRAVMEPEYREQLFSNPDKALEGYGLSEEETKALKGIKREKFEAVAGELEDRISKAGIGAMFLDDRVRDPVVRSLFDKDVLLSGYKY
jgi:hypothetical protein